MKTEPTQGCDRLLSAWGTSIRAEDVFLVLGAIQDEAGCIPRAALEEVARRSGLSVARLYGAVTAYPDLTIEEG